MIGLALALALASGGAPYSERCLGVRQRIESPSVPDDVAAALARDLGPPPLDEGSAADGTPRPGLAPALDAAIAALEEAPSGDRTAPRDALAQTVGALCEAHGGPAAEVDRAALASILDRPEFDARHTRDWAVTRLLMRVWELIKDFLQGQGFEGFSELSRTVFLAAVVCFIAFGALRLVWGRRRRARARSEATGPTPAEAVSSEIISASAAELSRQGDFRGALKAHMRALVQAALESRLTDATLASTNHEIADDLGQLPGFSDLARQLEALAAQFDGLVYGLGAVGARETQAFAERAHGVRISLREAAMVGRPPEAPTPEAPTPEAPTPTPTPTPTVEA